MNLICVICTDSFKGSDDVNVTKCGHMFHNTCLTKWFERSHSCPQCRAKCTVRNVTKIFFNVTTTDPTSVDADALHQEIDTLTLKVREADKELFELREEKKVDHVLAAQSKKIIHDLEKKISSHKVTLATMVVQLDMAKSRNENQDSLKAEIQELKVKMEHMNLLNNLIECTSKEADALLRSSDARTLSSMASSLKHELVASEQKRALLRRKVNALQNENKKLRDEEKILQERISEMDSENYSLKTQLKDLEQIKQANHASGNAVACVSPQNSRKRKLLASDLVNTPTRINDSPSDETPNSPYLNIASSMIGLTPLMKSTSSSNHPVDAKAKSANDFSNKFCIFKKSRLTEKTTTMNNANLVFNGLGGSEKPHLFPTPLRERVHLPGLNSKASRLKLGRLARPNTK